MVAIVLGISHLSPHSILEGRYSYLIFQRRKEVFKASVKNEWGWSSNPSPCDFCLHSRVGASPFPALGRLTSVDASDRHGGFWELMKLCEPGVIDKTRWLVNADEHTFEVDEFHGEHEGLVVAEVELNNPNETTKTPHFIGKEVTGIRCYYNSQLHTFDYRKDSLFLAANHQI